MKLSRSPKRINGDTEKHSIIRSFYLFYRIARDIELMTGSKPNIYWLICWKYITPVVILGTVYILDSKLFPTGHW